jgi:glycosyltransferase involved in cell wall biosynthesis
VRIAVDASVCANRRGFGRFARELLSALVARRAGDGFEYVLLLDREPQPGELPAPLASLERIVAAPRKKVTESAVAGGRRSLGDLFAFTKAAGRARADLVFLPAVYSAFPLKPGTRAVVCFHDTIAEEHPRLVFPDRKSEWFWRAKSWLAARQATRVMTVSSASKAALARAYRVPLDKIDVVTEGADPSFRPLSDRATVLRELARFDARDGPPYFLFVGGLSPHKNLKTLLLALRLLLGRHDAKLLLVGDPKADGFLDADSELRAIVEKDAKLKSRVAFTGFVDDESLVHLMNGAIALVMPSLLEGFGLPALEAMACGTPVLASSTGALPEVVGEAGLFFPPTDAAAMAHAMEKVVADPALREQLACKAVEQAGRFGWARGAELAAASFARALELGPALAGAKGR